MLNSGCEVESVDVDCRVIDNFNSGRKAVLVRSNTVYEVNRSQIWKDK